MGYAVGFSTSGFIISRLNRPCKYETPPRSELNSPPQTHFILGEALNVLFSACMKRLNGGSKAFNI